MRFLSRLFYIQNSLKLMVFIVSLFILSLFLAPLSSANSLDITAKIKSKYNSDEYVDAHKEEGFMRIDPFYYNEEVPPLIDAIFDNKEEDYLIEVKVDSEVKNNIVLEQRTVTTAWLHHEGPTMPTGVSSASKWKPMKKLDNGQYQLNNVEIIYPKNTLKKIIADDKLEDHWKDIARQCLKEKSTDCYSLNYVEHLEIRVIQKGRMKSKKLEKIIIEQGYGC